MKNTDICIELSLQKVFDKNNTVKILEALNDNLALTRQAIDFSTNDDEGLVDEDTVVFTAIHYDKARVFASWSFEWSIYSACQDHYYEASSQGSTELWINDNELRLKPFQYPEKPSTADEL